MTDTEQHTGNWAESPWMYLVLFTGVGLLAALAIAPKYARREAGLEQKYQARQEAARRQSAGQNSATPLPLASGEPSRTGEGRVRGIDTDYQQRPLLVPITTLLLLLALTLAAGTFMLIWTRAKQRKAQAQ